MDDIFHKLEYFFEEFVPHHHYKDIRVALFFKDFSHWVRSSCVGLNVAGYTTARYLRHRGIAARAYAVRNNIDIVKAIDEYNKKHGHHLTHVVVSAPWLSLHDLKSLIIHYPHIKFVILCHSNIGFLQADPNAIDLFRKYAKVAHNHKNFRIGGNSAAFASWFKAVYNEECELLPNLYPVQRIKGKTWGGENLKIGAFGAIRPEKNFMTAAAAALAIKKWLNVPMELHMSTGGDGCKSLTLPAIEEMVEDVRDVKLIRHHWNYWDQFIELVAKMDLVIQVSYTESFNMVTADSILRGVPVVVSPAIHWAPETWKANPDDAIDVAKTGVRLLTHKQRYRGADALIAHNDKSFWHWKEFLSTHCY